MALKTFFTGVTGYIGGDAFYALYNKHTEYSYSALAYIEQEPDQAKNKAYPKKVLEEEVAKVDIVLDAVDASDHEGAVRDFAKGLAAGHPKENPGFCKSDRLGGWSDKEYKDWGGVKELTILPDEALHRNVDRIGLEAGIKNGDAVKTAILCVRTGKYYPELWGAKGYFLTENRENVWSEFARKMGKKAADLRFTLVLKEDELEKDAALQQADFKAAS
ncbi:hypothetical protein K469DRAFT_736942 [Zopfia rhizophila CBS 207.26]|uniref:NAD(P)-binding protein n=1 Tax=Zopfia rhizophila CBS 207.26 TaxID=1314779 RepID=A0A6A6EEH4_9PEZI|nr:hypothetical protein K469DRAFT_736942 [Zopfia rhizophila CBS 207.26]